MLLDLQFLATFVAVDEQRIEETAPIEGALERNLETYRNNTEIGKVDEEELRAAYAAPSLTVCLKVVDGVHLAADTDLPHATTPQSAEKLRIPVSNDAF